MISLASPSPTMTTDYSDRFRRNIENALRYALRRATEDGDELSDATRELALQALEYSFKLPSLWKLTRQLLLELAPKMEMAGWRDEWVPYLQAGIDVGNAQEDLEAVGELHYQLGVIYQLLSQYEDTEKHFTLSADAFTLLGYKVREGRALIRKASAIRFTSRDFDKVQILVQHAFTIVGQDDYARGYGYLVLCLMELHNHQNYELALSHCQQNLALWKSADPRSIGWALSNLGAVYCRMAEFDTCITTCKQSLKHLEAVNDISHAATTYNTLGSAYHMSGKYEEALNWYFKAEPIFRLTNNVFQLAMLYNNCGMAYREIQEWDKAESVFLTAINKLEKLDTPRELADALDNLGMTYYAQKNYFSALVMYRRAMCEVYKLRGSGAYPSYRKMVIDHLKETRNKM